MKSGKHQRSKKRCQNLCWKVHDRAQSLFCIHTLCMVTYSKHFYWLVFEQLLCSVHGKRQRGKQKHTEKNFVEFHNHSPLLTIAFRS